METVFLSYTYRPHPDHQPDLEKLRSYVVRAVEAMGLRVIDGVDVGGHPLDDALRRRIEDADALIALVTPQADDAGGLADPAFVLSEFQYAMGQSKPTMRVLHHLQTARGLGASHEYTPWRPSGEVDVILKLMNTIALWKREYGQMARVRIEPEDLAARYDETQGDRCEFQVISQSGNFRDFQRASLFLEPGAAYALLPKLRVGERVRVRLRQGNTTWQSRYAIDPFVGGVRLEERP
ncbi:toll/interleukin-1 receptor domain-containing protein [Rhizobium sp. WYCCWR 11290]|uniref:Toll/interleukin-1 receptor domain-containing protein n=1 Tax=Rhizobium changzhiense TaxID=2692317 RepID=A0A7Z0UIA6_9HYPH|nr:toll/interleukin-1 receptor domain-containing protein [Rhizobium changzhiense]NZD66261.1 toll/interleukin-1 receptor domain-containing protein [Rhizobium changzhiense]